MATITVFGGNGYTGAAVVREAAARGHQVTSVGRSAPNEPIEGVTYVQGSVTSGDPSSLVAESDIVVATLSPRGELAGKVASIYQSLAGAAQESGTRLIVIGGFTSLRRASGGPRIVDSEEINPVFADEAREMAGFADWLLSTPEQLDWLYVSPAAAYGAFNPGEVRGTYRLGADVALFDADGKSELSGPDFATALVDVIDSGEHHRTHLSVVY
jgi:putative NADH-flavin reductase